MHKRIIILGVAIGISLILNSCRNINQYEYAATMQNIDCYISLIDAVKEPSISQKLKEVRSTKIIFGAITQPDDYKCIERFNLVKYLPKSVMDSCFHMDSKLTRLECLRITDDNKVVVDVSMVRRMGVFEQLSRYETREFHRVITGSVTENDLTKFIYGGEEIVRKELVGDDLYYIISQMKL